MSERKATPNVWLTLAAGGVLGIICLACLALAALAVLAPARRAGLPVTGGLPSQQNSPSPTQPPGENSGYGAEARLRLAGCNQAFHTFFMLVQAGAGDPAVQPALEQAVADFREQCALLSSLPTAPPRYADVDRWLKLAATEVDPAADLLAQALEARTDLLYGPAGERLARFITYIAHAEAALSQMEDFKEARVE